jgi:hypothetical protein
VTYQVACGIHAIGSVGLVQQAPAFERDETGGGVVNPTDADARRSRMLHADLRRELEGSGGIMPLELRSTAIWPELRQFKGWSSNAVDHFGRKGQKPDAPASWSPGKAREKGRSCI